MKLWIKKISLFFVIISTALQCDDENNTEDLETTCEAYAEKYVNCYNETLDDDEILTEEEILEGKNYVANQCIITAEDDEIMKCSLSCDIDKDCGVWGACTSECALEDPQRG